MEESYVLKYVNSEDEEINRETEEGMHQGKAEHKREIKDREKIENKDYIIFSDKDGTLDLETLEGCQKLAVAIRLIEEKNNGLFVITTARPAGEVEKILQDKMVPVPQYIIGDNGFIYDTKAKQYITKERLPKNEMLHLIGDMIKSRQASRDEIEFSTGDVVVLQDCQYTAKTKQYERRLGTRIFSKDVVQSLVETQKEILSLSFRVSSLEAIEKMKEYLANNQLKVQMNYQSLDDGNFSVDLAPEGIHKATSVLKLSQLAMKGDLGREDICGKFICIGDGSNDVTMLTAALVYGESAVIADKDSEESQELEAGLMENAKRYQGFAAGKVKKLEGKANDYILTTAKQKLAQRMVKKAVGNTVLKGSIPNAEQGKPSEKEKIK